MSSAKMIERITLYQLSFPLIAPYKLSSGDLVLFDPIVVEVRDTDGRAGWGEALIIPGYTPESVGDAWNLCVELSGRIAGMDAVAAQCAILSRLRISAGAASALLAAIDMMEDHHLLSIGSDTFVPLLAPCQAHDPAEIQTEVDRLICEGFRTLKVKVGYRWQDDLERVGHIQQAVAGRATLRLDANRAFNEADGKAFASRLDPRGIELFEQPCGSDAWAENAAVAAASTVPVMLDESIYDAADIDRAAAISGVGYVKLKLKKIGSLDMLVDGLQRIGDLGMKPVLGDGVSIEIGCWMEACVAARAINNAGEMNGFLKAKERLFANPLEFSDGAIVLRAGYRPEIDYKSLKAHTLRSHTFSARTMIA
jgi:L-alanine-DL-glutamate epimerase-like enolase superfamily enzyme